MGWVLFTLLLFVLSWVWKLKRDIRHAEAGHAEYYAHAEHRMHVMDAENQETREKVQRLEKEVQRRERELAMTDDEVRIRARQFETERNEARAENTRLMSKGDSLEAEIRHQKRGIGQMGAEIQNLKAEIRHWKGMLRR